MAKHPPNQSSFSRAVINHVDIEDTPHVEDRKFEEIPNFNAAPLENDESVDQPSEEAILINRRKSAAPSNTKKVSKQNTRKKAFMNEDTVNTMQI